MKLQARTIAIVATFAVALTLLTSGGQAAFTPVYGKVVTKPASTTNDGSMVIFEAGSNVAVAQIDFSDCDSDGQDATDPWYLDLNGDNEVSTNDIRITAVPSACGATFSAGTVVKSSDGDNDDLLTDGAFEICWRDTLDQFNNTFNPGETAYLALDDDCSAGIESADGDVIIATGTFGSRGTTTAGLGVSIETTYTGETFAIYDLDNSGGYTTGDGVYLDLPYNPGGLDEIGYASPGDIRFTTALGGSLGSIVDRDDNDVVHRLTTLVDGTARIDTDGDDIADAFFTWSPQIKVTTDDVTGGTAELCTGTTPPKLYLDIDTTGTEASNDVEFGDLRLTTSAGSIGTFVPLTGTDRGADLDATVLTTRGKTFDIGDTNGVFDNKPNTDTEDDGILFDTNDDGNSDTGEVRLSKTPAGSAGTCVASGNSDNGLDADADLASADFAYFDSDNGGFYNRSSTANLDDGVYIDVDGDGYASVADVRLSSLGGSYGTTIDSDDLDVVYVLELLDGATVELFCFLDNDNDGTYENGESVYMMFQTAATCADRDLAAADLRLSSFQSLAAGKLLVSSNADAGKEAIEIAGATPMFWNAGQAGFQDGDAMFVDLRNLATDEVDLGDLAITALSVISTNAGEVIGSGDTTLGSDLVAFAGYDVGAFDVDGDEGFSVDDILVWDNGHGIDTDGSGTADLDGDGDLTADVFINSGDAYLSGSGGTTSSFTTSGGSGGTTPPTTGNNSPTASFTCTGTIGDSMVTVNAAGSTDSDGTITSYAFDWGDGATGTGSALSHTYASPGTYSLKLTVTDDDGATRSSTKQVKIPLEKTDCLAIQVTPPPPPDGGETPPAGPVDTDGDGVSDEEEVDEGTDPNDPDDFPGADEDDDDGDGGRTPGFELVFLLAAIGAVLWISRRRKA